ncbi:MAG TPA: sigma-54 dependent transcriptional regulator [Bryobacteraceae bacterium]|jgi:DNA-binding NtrC family response regulator|nr:sigma-54 dependent transcriptional regulator [Bryobacteraceae bacterium]
MASPKILWIHGSAPQTDQDVTLALSDFDVTAVADLAGAHEILSHQEMDCALVQGPVPDGDRMLILESLRDADSFLPVVFYDLEMTAAEGVRLHRSGAYHCLGYRDSLDALRECLDQAAEERRCQSRRRFSAPRESWRDLLVGDSAAMQRVVDTIRLVGARRCTVLISGESGTGKELVARAIHLASPRAHQNMVAINCTALPEHLLEAEMFGHTKGAFTGAVTTRVGRFEQAHKGTLFLDEIADMPLEMQAKLLRVLQDREFQRLGSSEVIKVDVRVIAASNVNLLERVRQGRFREDLYYRLNVVPLQLPALREREGDVPLLVYHLVQKICQREAIPVRRLAPETLESLKACSWPGNVRQLENSVEMAIALCGERDILYPRDLGMAEPVARKVVSIDVRTPSAPLSQGVDFETAVTRFQLAMLQQALTQTGGNKTAAAELLGMKRTTLIMKLRAFEGVAV